MKWKPEIEAKTQELIDMAPAPAFMRAAVGVLVKNKAEGLAKERDLPEVGEAEMVEGFLMASPAHFRPQMLDYFARANVDLEPHHDILVRFDLATD